MSSIEAIHTLTSGSNLGITITEMFFDTLVEGQGDADTISGGDGNDLIYGGQGGDSISGGADADTIFGDSETVAADGAELLTNGDFAGNLTGWTVLNPTGGQAPVYEGGGSDFVRLNSADEAAGGDGIEQSVTTMAGHVYSATVELGQDGGGSGTHTVTVEVLDSGGAVLATRSVNIAQGGSASVALTFTAADASSTLRITNPSSTSTVSTDVTITGASVNQIAELATGGNDSIDAGDGADFVDAGDGADTVIGGLGADTIYGGAGSDSISGGDGADLLVTGDGQDTLDGGAGDDTLTNGAGDDSLVGGTGNDSIVASLGNDTLEGGAGNDTLQGGEDNDSILGGDDNDLIYGDAFALSLNDTGTDGFASVSSFSDMPTTEVSYEITFSSTTPGTTHTTLLSYAVGASHNELLLDINGTDLRLITQTGSGPTVDISAYNLFDGNVHSVAFTWDSATGTTDFYVDGALIGSGTTATGALTPGGTFLLGQDQDSEGGGFNSNEIFHGEIYQAALWGDIRTSSEIATGAGTLGADGSDPNLVANWTPDPENARMTDTKGGNHLTLSGDASIEEVFSGDDTLEGGAGYDTIYGGAGDDLIDGGVNHDTLYGGKWR